jgi:hypothetical protein
MTEMEQLLNEAMSKRKITRTMEYRDLVKALQHKIGVKRLGNIVKRGADPRKSELKIIAEAVGITLGEIASGELLPEPKPIKSLPEAFAEEK